MKKNFLAILIAGIMTFTLISCSKDRVKVEDENTKPAVTEKEDDNSGNEVGIIKNIEVSKDEMIKISNEYFGEFEKKLIEDGLPVGKADKADGVIVTDYIGLENLGDKPRKPYELFNCDLTAPETPNGTAGFRIFIEYPIDPKDIEEGKEFKIEEIGFEKYANVLLKDQKWDYEKINKEINDQLKNMTTEYTSIEAGMEDGSKEGLTGGFVVFKDVIIYKVGTPMYIFK